MALLLSNMAAWQPRASLRGCEADLYIAAWMLCGIAVTVPWVTCRATAVVDKTDGSLEDVCLAKVRMRDKVAHPYFLEACNLERLL